MTLSKESPADQIKSWTKNINMFKSDCANILVSYKSKQVAAAASDPVVKQKQQALDNEKNTQAGNIFFIGFNFLYLLLDICYYIFLKYFF